MLRRTDEALLDLINSAESTLTLVSYALYRIERLTAALHNAVSRKVEVRMFVEAENASLHDMVSLYGEFLVKSMNVYYWARDSQSESVNLNRGVLHAKAAIADQKRLLVSSANLTEYALSSNIELGLMIGGGDLPQRADRIFSDYVVRNVFRRLDLLE
jgi:phosphatidylserine/phosphatidylglycerophosphate/cardiolipin synthase-like enzyme